MEERILTIINSCKNKEQLKTAERYYELSKLRFGNSGKISKILEEKKIIFGL